MRALMTALTIATLSFGAIEAQAKGGNDGRDEVKAELAEARKKNASSNSDGGFFSSIFGSEQKKPIDTTAKSKK
ncbi:MAG: hypothetical protein AAF317_10965 [Pseudomonadota bacterium]